MECAAVETTAMTKKAVRYVLVCYHHPHESSPTIQQQDGNFVYFRENP